MILLLLFLILGAKPRRQKLKLRSFMGTLKKGPHYALYWFANPLVYHLSVWAKRPVGSRTTNTNQCIGKSLCSGINIRIMTVSDFLLLLFMPIKEK